MNGNLWLMSNRQPWTDMVVSGLISSKTRDNIYFKPGDIVLLHASKTLWDGWENLVHLNSLSQHPTVMPRGGVYGMARVAAVGKTGIIMPGRDFEYFNVWSTHYYLPTGEPAVWNCAMDQCVFFDVVVRLPFVTCRGSQRPAKKLPPEILQLFDSSNQSPTAQLYRDALEGIMNPAQAGELQELRE